MTQPTRQLLEAVAAVLRQPVPKEFCCECGGVFPAGSHAWTDLEGMEHSGCANHSRGQAYLYGMRANFGIEEEDSGKKRAKGYAVK